jgi:hypothetical protein
MKFNKFVGTAGLGALSVALLSTSAMAQSTNITVPKSIADFNNIADLDPETDACAKLAQDDPDVNLTYTQFLNKDYCSAKILADAQKAKIADDDLAGTVTNEEGDLTSAERDLTSAKTAYDNALKAKAGGDEVLAGLQKEVATAQGLADAKAAALADAYEKVLADFFASDAQEFTDIEAYIEGNATDENVVAYTTAKTEFDLGRQQVADKQTALTAYEDGAYAQLDEAVVSTRTALFGEDGTETEPTPDSVQGLYNEAVEDYDAAVTALSSANATLAELNAKAEKALASNVSGTRNDDILASTGNPAKAVLQTSDCLASGAEDCDNDVGQALVDGLDSLHLADQALGARLTTAEGDIVDLKGGLVAETRDRKAADDVLQKNIDNEVKDRKAADLVLQTNIDNEVKDRKAADVVLQANIDKEVTDRKAADTTLQNNINAEVAARTAADVTLQNNINTVNTRVTQLGERVDSLTKESRQGIAMAMALAAIPTVNYGKFSLGLGVGTFASETAAALGMDFVVSERVKFKLGVTTTGDETGGSAGIAIGF